TVFPLLPIPRFSPPSLFGALRLWLSAPAVVFALGSAPGCVCGHGGPPPEAGKDFGDFGGTSVMAADAAPYLALARAVAEHRSRDTVPAPPARTGRRVFLTLWPGAPADGPQ